MTIHASGSALTATQILNELAVSSPVTGSWSASATLARRREITDIAAGALKFSDFYSKCAFAQFVANTAALNAVFDTGHGGLIFFQFGCRNYLTPGNAFDYIFYAMRYDPPYPETVTGYEGIVAAKTNLRSGAVEGKIREVSAPSGPGSPASNIYEVLSGTGVGAASNVWKPLSATQGLTAQLASGTSFTGASDVNTWVLEVGLRWSGVIASEVYKTFTITLSHA